MTILYRWTPRFLGLMNSFEEVAQLILNFHLSNTSCSLYGVSSFLLKSCTTTSISAPLYKKSSTYLFLCLFPSQWKHSSIVPISKTSPPSCSPVKYQVSSLKEVLLNSPSLLTTGLSNDRSFLREVFQCSITAQRHCCVVVTKIGF